MSSSESRPGPVKAEDAALAALHALRALDPKAASAFEARLDDDQALEAEVESLRSAAERLLPLVVPVPPQAMLLDKILAAVRVPSAASGEADADHAASERDNDRRAPDHTKATPFTEGVKASAGGAGGTFDLADRQTLQVLAHDDGAFHPLRVPGVSMRILHRDDGAGYATVLVKMQPGAAYPAHRHGGDEECFVLEGDLQVGDDRMTAGDYQLAPAGSVHPVQSTRGGCVLFLRSSLHDELLEAL